VAGRLEIKVEEHRPAARWGEGRGELVNTFGEVFAATAPEERQAPCLCSTARQGTAPEVLKRYGEFVGSFKALGQRPVQVTLSPRLAWQLKLENGMLVDMGREQPKVAGRRCACSALSRSIRRLVGKRATRPAVVDLRYPNGFAMRVAGEGKGK
jgi:cell division protein FtsQ